MNYNDMIQIACELQRPRVHNNVQYHDYDYLFMLRAFTRLNMSAHITWDNPARPDAVVEYKFEPNKRQKMSEG